MVSGNWFLVPAVLVCLAGTVLLGFVHWRDLNEEFNRGFGGLKYGKENDVALIDAFLVPLALLTVVGILALLAAVERWLGPTPKQSAALELESADTLELPLLGAPVPVAAEEAPSLLAAVH